MEAGAYDFEDWESDFAFLGRYVFSSESSDIPPDYVREIEAYFRENYAEADAAFRSERALAALRFLISNIQSFTVSGMAKITEERVELSDSLRYSLWSAFCLPDSEHFDPNPDPQKILEDAEGAEGLFDE